MERTQNERMNMTLHLISRDPGHVFMHVDADDLETLNGLGLVSGNDENGFYVELLIDVSDEKEAKLVVADDVDLMVSRLNNAMYEANSELVAMASQQFWEQLRSEQKIINESNLKTLQEEFEGTNMIVDLDESGDFFLDFDHTDNAFVEGNGTIPATKQMAFSMDDARKIGSRMISERELKARQAIEDDPSIDYDFVSKGTWNRLSEQLHKAEPFTVAGVNTSNKPRLFAIASEGYGVVSRDPMSKKEREAIVAESARHLEILKSFYIGKGILILTNDDLGGVNVGYWHEDAFNENITRWRASNIYCRSYVEAGQRALQLVKEQNNPKRPSNAQSNLSGYPIPPAVRAQQEAMRAASMRA